MKAAISESGDPYKVVYYNFWSKRRRYWRWQVIDGNGLVIVQGERRNNTMVDAQLDVQRLVAFLDAIQRGDTDLEASAGIVSEGSAYEIVHYPAWFKGLYVWRWRIKDGDEIVARGKRRTACLMDSKGDLRAVANFFDSLYRTQTRQALAGEL